MRHPSIPDAIPVPVHGNQPIKKGTLGSILRTAGISREDFIGCPDGPRRGYGASLDANATLHAAVSWSS